MLATGSDDNAIRCYNVDFKKQIFCKIRWIVGVPALSFEESNFDNATGLTNKQKMLIEQKGGSLVYTNSNHMFLF